MRTQISLPDEHHAAVRRRAADLGITMAEYIRRLVAEDLDEASPAGDPMTVIGLGASGGSDIARDKDSMVAAAIAGHRR